MTTVNASPYIDVRLLPVAIQLQQEFDTIRAQATMMLDATASELKPNWTLVANKNLIPPPAGQQMYQGKNFTCHLRVVDALLTLEEKALCHSPGAESRRALRRQLNPKLMDVLRPVLDKVGNIGFNTLHPHASIAPHYGVSTNYFRLHMGITTDQRCTFYVQGGDPYTWQPGQIMAFADGHWLHWVRHQGTVPRTILSIDFDKSLLEDINCILPEKIMYMEASSGL